VLVVGVICGLIITVKSQRKKIKPTTKKKKAAVPKKRRIMVIEDEVDTITRLYIGLIRMDFDVEVSDNTDDLRARLSRFKPHVLLLALHLQNDGLCREVKEKFGIPIIISAPLGSDNNNVDVDEMVFRPVNLPELGQKITMLVERYGGEGTGIGN
jgi:DNA-binding response OmpR family regulator